MQYKATLTTSLGLWVWFQVLLMSLKLLQITSATTGGEIGYITPEPASMHARFDQFLDEGPKAIIIAYAVQLALCKYRMLNLNLQ